MKILAAHEKWIFVWGIRKFQCSWQRWIWAEGAVAIENGGVLSENLKKNLKII